MSVANVLIGLPMINSVYADFFKSFNSAQLLRFDEGVATVEMATWDNGVNNRNKLVKSCLQGDFTHLFIMDIDNTFPEFTLSRLLSHDKDVVGGFYTTKKPPFHSTCFINNKSYVPQNGEKLKQVDIVASGCMLIKRKVLESMKWPYFFLKPDYKKQEFASEDIGFCENVRNMGLEVWCDFSICCGHIGSATILPCWENDQIKIGISV